MIECPKCGFTQDDAAECARCGVIFAKIQAGPPDGPCGSNFPSPTCGKPANEGAKWILLLFLLPVLGYLLHQAWTGRDLRYPPGILISSEPRQTIIKNPIPWKKDKRLIFPLAAFSLEARVLGKEKYRCDYGADISPIDLALGWGPMSDQGILDRLEITQGGRCFFIFPVEGKTPMPMDVLLANSSNMHMLPANARVEKTLDSLRIGELVQLSGYLVGINEGGQWTWVSSLSRTDTGNGACEVFWVERATRLYIEKGAQKSPRD